IGSEVSSRYFGIFRISVSKPTQRKLRFFCICSKSCCWFMIEAPFNSPKGEICTKYVFLIIVFQCSFLPPFSFGEVPIIIGRGRGFKFLPPSTFQHSLQSSFFQ